MFCLLARAQETIARPSSDPVKPMRIGVIGAGSLGGTVGRVLVQAGHEVKFSSRHPGELGSITRELGRRASSGTAREAAEFGTVLLCAVLYDALPELGRDLQNAIRGKVVLDACNPLGGSESALAREAMANGVGPTSAKLLPGARLVRAFSAVDATAVETSFKGQSEKLGVPLAGDNSDSVQVAAQLVRDAGCQPVIVGNLAAAKSFQRAAARVSARTQRRRNCAHLLGMKEGK